MKDTLSFARMRSMFFATLLIALGAAVAYVFLPFFYPIFWAAVLAILFYPTYRWINLRLKVESLSALVTEFFIIIVILVPLIIFSFLLVHESFDLYRAVSGGVFFPGVQTIAERLSHTTVGPYVAQAQGEWTAYTAEAARNVSFFLFTRVKSITQNSVEAVFFLFLMLYSLYYFLKDGPRLLSRLTHLSPLGDAYEKILYDRVTSAVRATLKGNFIIGAIQGALGAVLFLLTGVPGALVWGVVMIATALIPGIGAFLVWLPAGIIMIILGNVWQGITILVFGAFVISLIDNVIRPMLVGKETQLHPLLILFSTLGGLLLFGISGFVIGPILVSLFLSVVSMYDHYYRSELGRN